MSLYRRLIGLDEPKIPVHQFMAALAEFKRGKFTGPQVLSMFQLSPAEQTELAALRTELAALWAEQAALKFAEKVMEADSIRRRSRNSRGQTKHTHGPPFRDVFQHKDCPRCQEMRVAGLAAQPAKA